MPGGSWEGARDARGVPRGVQKSLRCQFPFFSWFAMPMHGLGLMKFLKIYENIQNWNWTEYGTMIFNLKTTLSGRPTPNARATRFCFVVVHTLCTCFPYSYGLCQLSWRIFSTLFLAFFMSCNTYGNCWGFLTMVHSAVLNVWCSKPYNSL